MISEPTIVVTCDDCGYEDTFSLTCTARGWDDRDLASEMKHYKWLTVSGSEHYCEDCAKKKEATNAVRTK